MESLRLISSSFRTEYKKTTLQLKARPPPDTYKPAGALLLGPHHSLLLQSLTADSGGALRTQIIDCFLVYAVLTAAVQARG